MENVRDFVGNCVTKAPHAQAKHTEHTYEQLPSYIVKRIDSTSNHNDSINNLRRHDCDLYEGTTVVATTTGGAHDNPPHHNHNNTRDPRKNQEIALQRETT